MNPHPWPLKKLLTALACVALATAPGCSDDDDDDDSAIVDPGSDPGPGPGPGPDPDPGPGPGPDPGPAWTVQFDGGAGSVRRIDAVDATHAWAVNFNSLLRTQDGGTTWAAVLEGQAADVDFFSSSQGWMHTPTEAAVSTNGGATWTTRLQVPGGLRAMSFVSMTTGWLTTQDGKLMRTTDGGTTWTTLELPSPDATMVKFVDTHSGWLGVNTGFHEGGTVYRTTDAGATWNVALEVAGGNNLVGLEAVSSDRAWAMTSDGFLKQTILRTTNAGSTWTPHSGDPFFDAGAIRFVNSSTGWLGGAELHRTTDGGATWTLVPTPDFDNSLYFSIQDIAFIDAETGWISGMKGQNVNGIDGFIMKTTTGGE